MGIEENIERIANAIETIADVQLRMLKVAEWNQARLEGKATSSETAAGEPKADEPVETPDRQMTYDELKAELLKRGIAVPKGTKMTTLQKLWAEHKDDEVLTDANSVPPREEVSAAVGDISDDPAPAEGTPKAMTAEEARKLLTEHCSGTAEDKQLMLSALAKVGATRFSEVKEGQFEALVEAFLALKGEAK